MKCPFCAHGENKVIDSRISKDGDAIRRRRECLGCGNRFTTYEFVEEVLPMVEEQMKTAIPLDVAMVVEMGVGENWLAAH